MLRFCCTSWKYSRKFKNTPIRCKSQTAFVVWFQTMFIISSRFYLEAFCCCVMQSTYYTAILTIWSLPVVQLGQKTSNRNLCHVWIIFSEIKQKENCPRPKRNWKQAASWNERMEVRAKYAKKKVKLILRQILKSTNVQKEVEKTPREVKREEKMVSLTCEGV